MRIIVSQHIAEKLEQEERNEAKTECMERNYCAAVERRKALKAPRVLRRDCEVVGRVVQCRGCKKELGEDHDPKCVYSLSQAVHDFLMWRGKWGLVVGADALLDAYVAYAGYEPEMLT